MLKKLKIVQFRSIHTMDLNFEKRTAIIGKNWAWKTNILQAICHVFGKKNEFSFDDMLQIWWDYMYLEAFFEKDNFENKVTFSYDKTTDKKLITLNGKKATKKQLFEHLLKISYFSPIQMNLFYLWPKTRRDFLDSILSQTFLEYDTLLKNYEKIVKNRNKVLKNIFEGKSKKEEIDFWNTNFIQTAKKIYEYKIPLNKFIQQQIQLHPDVFQNKITRIDYTYITKVNLENIEESIQTYLDKNFERDIILWKTHIWPHIDDFDVLINGKSLTSFASRGEIKSIILILKQIEIQYIKQITWIEPILLIDDLGSELDEEHFLLMLEKTKELQIIYTAITAIEKEKTNIFLN